MNDKPTITRLATGDRAMQSKRFADVVMGQLRDYIPDKLFKEAWRTIADAAYENELEISNGEQRKKYEAVRKLVLEYTNLQPETITMSDGKVEKL